MNKIDRRIAYMIVLDCESCPCDKDVEKVDPYNMFAYDLGWAVVDKRGNVYEQRSFAIRDIFMEEKELMRSAYYFEKLPKYWEDIKSGERVMKSFNNVRKQLLEDIETYRVEKVFAHNARFDYGTLTNTQRWLTKSRYRYFFPKSVTVYDSLKGARQVIGKMPTYRRFCEENNYLCKNGTPRFTAEVLYRFITKNTEFEEEHQGLADVLIEKEIVAYIYRQHKKMDMKLFG